MQSLKTRCAPVPLQWIAGVALLLAASGARGDPGVVAARTLTVATRLEAYAQFEPRTVLKVNTPQTGVVAGFHVLPGQKVKAGAVLGRLTGPEADALVAASRARLDAARAALESARRVLSAERSKEAEHLGTREDVFKAEAALAAARADFQEAAARDRAAGTSLTLRAPAAGTVLEVRVAAGERVEPPQTLLTLEPEGSLWVRADFFGADAQMVRVGMTGTFAPADGGALIAVKALTLVGSVGPGGGRSVGLVALRPRAGWRSGDRGTVVLEAGRRSFVTVPTRALILDRGT